jgi:hypothetical protein
MLELTENEMQNATCKMQSAKWFVRPNLHFLVCILHVSFLATSQSLLASRCGAAERLQGCGAVVNITPPIPFRMSGYFNERLSTGTKDPLHAKAVVFKQGDESAALAFCDLVGISGEVSTKARQMASEATGIPFENIVVAATHSHTGPMYFGALSKHFHDRRVAQTGKDPYDPADYVTKLIDKIVQAIVQAKASLQPVELTSGVVEEGRLSFNRRFIMKDGSVRWNPGQLNPNIVRPAGPIDPQVGVVLIKRPGADIPEAAIVSFAMHLDTTGGSEYSADYPRFVEDYLRKPFGPPFMLLFGSGTCGNINHIDVSLKSKRPPEEIGQMLGETIERAVRQPELWSKAEPALAVRRVIVDAPLQTFSDAEVAAAGKNMDLIGTRDLPFLEQVNANKIMDMERWDGGSIPLEVQAFRLNRDTAIVSLPAEIFVEIGLAIKAASPFKNTLVIELGNESLGYIPDKKGFAEGAYEAVNSRVEPGTGERLVEAAIGLLKELE